jgi:hypothetical protein
LTPKVSKELETGLRQKRQLLRKDFKTFSRTITAMPDLPEIAFRALSRFSSFSVEKADAAMAMLNLRSTWSVKKIQASHIEYSLPGRCGQ